MNHEAVAKTIVRIDAVFNLMVTKTRLRGLECHVLYTDNAIYFQRE